MCWARQPTSKASVGSRGKPARTRSIGHSGCIGRRRRCGRARAPRPPARPARRRRRGCAGWLGPGAGRQQRVALAQRGQQRVQEPPDVAGHRHLRGNAAPELGRLDVDLHVDGVRRRARCPDASWSPSPRSGVPSPTTTSASASSRLDRRVRWAPRPPADSGWSSGIAPRPARLVSTGRGQPLGQRAHAGRRRRRRARRRRRSAAGRSAPASASAAARHRGRVAARDARARPTGRYGRRSTSASSTSRGRST